MIKVRNETISGAQEIETRNNVAMICRFCEWKLQWNLNNDSGDWIIRCLRDGNSSTDCATNLHPWFCEWNESLGPSSKHLLHLLIIFYTRFQCCCLSCSRVAGCVRRRTIWRIMTEIISARVSLQIELELIIPLFHEHIGDCLTSFSICCLSCQYSCPCFSPWFAQQGSERSCVGKFNIFPR